MSPRSSISGPFVRLLDASAGVLTQPKGSVPRVSNMLGSKRGSLRTCDGSSIVNAFNGVPTPGRGKALCEFFYEPAGVAAYYLRIMKALDQNLFRPTALAAADAGPGGSFLLGTQYFWAVTACDGVGGETTVSGEATFTQGGTSHLVTLTWNIVPNALFYNIYQGGIDGNRFLLYAPNLPVLQPPVGTTTVTFTVDGTQNITENLDVVGISGGIGGNYTIQLVRPFNAAPGAAIATYTAGSNPTLNGSYANFYNAAVNVLGCTGAFHATNITSSGGTLTLKFLAPTSNTTQQTGLYAMPPGISGITYTNANLVALFPADIFAPIGAPPIDSFPGGGGSSGTGPIGGTPSGGHPGLVSSAPEMVQFTNQVVIALGNGFQPQIYSDHTGTPDNVARESVITSISADSHGTVTVNLAQNHLLDLTQSVGANVILSGVTNPDFNGVFPTIALPSSTSLQVFNLVAAGESSSGGIMIVTTQPIISTFVPAFPQWASGTFVIGNLVQPNPSNGFYYRCIQGGTSGTTQPAFTTVVGNQTADGGVIWVNQGTTFSAGPPPPAAAHVAVFAGSLWVFNTWTSTTSNNLDGPSSLRMSTVNNANSWNPINQAFLDKDDGLDGFGLASFTIEAQGIPPEGSLIAFKCYAMYQIIGVFGADNFAIQRVLTDMGTIAPKTIQFVPGFGLTRLTHLGVAVFDGVNDRVISEPIRPYLFGDPNDRDNADITPMDQDWMAFSHASQTGNPPMAIFAIPVGPGSGGALTRILCYDMALKGWAIADLPFPVSTLLQVRTAISQVVTLMGSYSDGTLQRWMAGDQQWATSQAGSGIPAAVSWGVLLPSTAAREPDRRIYARRIVVTGQVGQGGSTMVITPRQAGTPLHTQTQLMPVSGDFSVQAAIGRIDRRFDAVVTGVGQITIDGFNVHLEAKPMGVLSGAIS